MSGPDLAWQLLSNVDSVTGTDGRCISTMGQTALIMVQPVHYTGSFIGGVHNQAPDCTSHTISQSVGCAIVWYNQATIRELLPKDLTASLNATDLPPTQLYSCSRILVRVRLLAAAWP
jgi:hypothetical protein